MTRTDNPARLSGDDWRVILTRPVHEYRINQGSPSWLDSSARCGPHRATSARDIRASAAMRPPTAVDGLVPSAGVAEREEH